MIWVQQRNTKNELCPPIIQQHLMLLNHLRRHSNKDNSMNGSVLCFYAMSRRITLCGYLAKKLIACNFIRNTDRSNHYTFSVSAVLASKITIFLIGWGRRGLLPWDIISSIIFETCSTMKEVIMQTYLMMWNHYGIFILYLPRFDKIDLPQQSTWEISEKKPKMYNGAIRKNELTAASSSSSLTLAATLS